MLCGKFLDQFPTSIGAAVIENIDMITPTQCRKQSFLQNIRLVLDHAQSMDFHITVLTNQRSWTTTPHLNMCLGRRGSDMEYQHKRITQINLSLASG
jgi:hypothetical protein